MKTIEDILNHLEKYSIYYLSRYSVTKKKYKNIIKRKINKEFISRKISIDQKNNALSKINLLLQKYVDLKIIDEENFIKNKIEFLVRKGTSIRKIHLILNQDGFDKPLINNSINDLKLDSDIEIKLLNTYCKKKKLVMYDQLWNKENIKMYNKTLNHLLRAGFDLKLCNDFFKLN